MLVKPPIGVMPRHIWLLFLESVTPSNIEVEHRKLELGLAIRRYKDNGLKVSENWILEYEKY